MQYDVRAKPKATELQRFWTWLNDGTIGSQEPDGREIVASMKRAVLTAGVLEWTETCYCNPPLNHERTTVYDQFFTNIKVQAQTMPTSLKGEKFWSHLREMFGETSKADTGGALTAGLRYVPLRLL